MGTNYAKRALEILREEGPIELSKRSTRFLLNDPLRLVDPQYHRRFKFHTWKNDLQNRIKYDAPPAPYENIIINPNKIKYRLNRTNGLKHPHIYGLGQIKSGDWDRPTHLQSVEETTKVKGMIQRFEKGKPWSKTVYHKHYSEKYRENKKYEKKGYDSLEEYLQESFNGYDELCQNIKAHGYTEGHDGSRGRPDSSHPVRDKLEVLVAVARNGDMFLWDGHHRFGIARSLSIEIPAQVAYRHKQWQELRDEIHNNGLPEGRENLRDHPDLQDILSL